MKSRTRTANTQIDFSATGRQTKQLIVMNEIGYSFGERALFDNVNFSIKSGMRVGLVGQNGSGKTTLLRLVKGDLQPARGEMVRAEALRIVYFDQNRELDPNLTLRRALAPDSDSVIYQDRVIHVASWAARFLFDAGDLNQPVSRLSGGERARVLIAQLMLQPADVLLLDEPTNDLDIATLEILEESLLEFRGALVLVSHDRFLLDRVTNVVLGLDSIGRAEQFSDYSQWDIWQRERQEGGASEPFSAPQEPSTSPVVKPEKKRLSYLEAREFESMEGKVHEAEQVMKALQEVLEDPAIISDAAKLQDAFAKSEAARKKVEMLYSRWAELEKKQS